MQLNRFDLNLLVALDALLHERNVTRAARRVHVSQPTMSAALHKLREYFDDDLLVRVGRQMELTPSALALVEPVRNVLLGVEAALGTQPSFDPKTAMRTFRLMVQDFTSPRLLPRLLARLAEEAPGIHCQIEQFSQHGIARLERGEVDVCVCVDNARLFDLPALPESLRSIELAPIRWVVAVSADHPTIQGNLSREQFLGLPHIFARRAGDLGSVADAVRRFLPADLDVRVTSESVLQVAMLVASTPYLAILPDSITNDLAPVLNLRTFEVPAPMPDARVVALWHQRCESDPCHAWLRGILREASGHPHAQQRSPWRIPS